MDVWVTALSLKGQEHLQASSILFLNLKPWNCLHKDTAGSLSNKHNERELGFFFFFERESCQLKSIILSVCLTFIKFIHCLKRHIIYYLLLCIQNVWSLLEKSAYQKRSAKTQRRISCPSNAPFWYFKKLFDTCKGLCVSKGIKDSSGHVHCLLKGAERYWFF